MGNIYVPQIRNVRVRVEGGMVQIIEKGTLILDLPWQAARELSKAIRSQAARAEQNTKIENIVADQALLIRKGFPIALTNKPEVFKAAGNEAAHGRTLRRALPGGIPDKVTFGAAVVHGRPSKHVIRASGVTSGETIGKIGGR